ncbi:WhiB family transcriptional regulator [Saccharomonospora iraqiensis]|uniref:WhiB family transcriptional regulator n=1 Tax=Saccharomonospora iraqiensis TaxID=52698 RepID=UPI00040B02A7|nr:WhiB family transcriptional regulator [Saccharomonospora iraqiensis]
MKLFNLLTDRDWTVRARCRGMDTEQFFPVGFGRAAEAQTQEAKKVCHRCPVASECLTEALESNDFDGVRGGMSGLERAELVRRKEGAA